jgi:hypothetical protein
MSLVNSLDWTVDAFRSLARGDDHNFIHLLEAFEIPVTLEDSSTTVRTHFLARDINGTILLEPLADAMARFVVDFTIPRARIKKAFKEYETTGSTDAMMALRAEASELFVPSAGSGEGGELLLFLLMEKTLGYPQLLSKFPLKTSNNMHVHGSDGVHGQLREDGVLDLYWGESKLWQDSSKAISDCFESIAPFLDPTERTSRKRDLLLLRDHLNVDDQALAAHLIRYFDSKDEESKNVRWNGVCLVGFDVDAYPNPKVAAETELALIRAQVGRWHKAFLSRVKQHNLLSINIDIFCVPLPSVEGIRTLVGKKLGVI